MHPRRSSPALDEQGEWEEFTWDLSPVVPAEKTIDLQRDGLPKIGVFVSTGSILVGKIGKTKAFRVDDLPSALELQGLEFDALKNEFGSMWHDASYYATPETAGIVVEAHLDAKGNRSIAVVHIDRSAGV